MSKETTLSRKLVKTWSMQVPEDGCVAKTEQEKRNRNGVRHITIFTCAEAVYTICTAWFGLDEYL
jgi:hypothetical protein